MKLNNYKHIAGIPVLFAIAFLLIYACNSKNPSGIKNDNSVSTVSDSLPDVMQIKDYKGYYYYSVEGGSGAFGSLRIYPETDTTFLFYVEVNRGAPGYNSGAMYSRAYRVDAERFEAKDPYADCRFELKYSDRSFSIKDLGPEASTCCGANVGLDGCYPQQNDSIYEYFTTRTGGDTIFFDKISPEYFYNGYYDW